MIGLLGFYDGWQAMTRLDANCPHCRTKIGEVILMGDEYWLALGFADDEGVHGLLVRRVDGGICLACGGAYEYSPPRPDKLHKALNHARIRQPPVGGE